MSDSKLVLTDHDGGIIACFPGQSVLSCAEVEPIRDRLVAAIQESPDKALIVDFTGLGMLPSDVLGMLVDLHRMQHDRGGQLIVCGLRPEVHRVIRATRLDLVLQLADDPSEALDLAAGQTD
jgi:anti-anti-sigma factor